MIATRPHWWPAYIGLGSNLDAPLEQLESAFTELSQLTDSKLVLRSSLYRSKPLGPADQPDYINAVAALLTRLNPQDLLEALQGIERSHGRTRSAERWGPRTLDLDLLVYGKVRLSTEPLTLPHPRIAERNFVLLPLSEIAPHLVIPGLGSCTQLLQRISLTKPGIERLTG